MRSEMISKKSPIDSLLFSNGPVVEEGLIIGFSILAILIIVSLVLSILEWANGLVSGFFNNLGG